MCQTILVPLDGSARAEQALPLACHIACRTGAALHLTHVHVMYLFKERSGAWGPYDPKYDAQCLLQEQAYLDGVERRLDHPAATRVTTAVVQEAPVDGILAEARNREARLIVMATRQYEGLARRGFSDIAGDVARRAPVPVVLVPSRTPLTAQVDKPTPRHMLIPLDGSALAEEVLEPALELGGNLEVRFTLLRVVKHAGLDSDDSRDGSGHVPPEPHCAEAQAYLESVARRLRGHGTSVETRVAGGRAADGILWEAGHHHADFIALTTHAQNGFKRWLFGSVADELHRSSSIPFMVHRASSSQAKPAQTV